MKKTLFFFAAMLVLLEVNAQKEKNSSIEHRNVLKIGTNTYFTGDEFPFSISWETKVGNRESFQLGVLPRLQKYGDEKTSGFGFNLAYRKYISRGKTGLQGLFISPVVKIGFLTENNESTYYDYNSNPPVYITYKQEIKTSNLGIGFVFGQHWVFRGGFSLELSSGMGYFNNKYKTTQVGGSGLYFSPENESGIMPNIQIGFGIAF